MVYGLWTMDCRWGWRMAHVSEVEDPQRTEALFEVREVGTVRSVREAIVLATGLPSCRNGQRVTFANGAVGMVMGFTEQEVQILVFGSKGRIRAGDEVAHHGESFCVPVGEAFAGRIITSLCEPLDGRGPIASAESLPVFGEAPGVMERLPVEQTLETGTRILDAVIPIAKGQRQLVIGDRMTGKTTVGLDAILNQQGSDMLCVYCCIGKPTSGLAKVVRLLEARQAMPRTIVISAPASASVGEQYLSPYTAATLGGFFMRHGRDVLVVFDDLIRHAWIYRQLCLLLQRAPGREAYPGDIFYVHSQLLERAAALKPEHGGGTMTFFPVCDILQGDVTGFVPSNLVSMTDGQIYFSTTLFNKGIKPAIDFGLSVSRIGSKAQWPAMKELSGRLRLEYVQYQELLQMTQMRTNLSADSEAKLKRGEAITRLLVQDKHQPVPMEEQVVQLYALRKGLLDALTPEQLKRFKREGAGALAQQAPQLLKALRERKVLTAEIKQELDSALKHVMAQVVTG